MSDYSAVVDPRQAKNEVNTPVADFENSGIETATWKGELETIDNHPQATLRLTLDTGKNVVVRVSIGGSVNTGKTTVNAGVVISSNGLIALSWQEHYAMQQAIEEAVQMLTAMQNSLLTQLGDKLVGGE